MAPISQIVFSLLGSLAGGVTKEEWACPSRSGHLSF
jgi:hypothetical protein